MTLNTQVKLAAYIRRLINNNFGEIPESQIQCYLSVVGRIPRIDSSDFHHDTNVGSTEVRKTINLERLIRA